MTLLEQAGMLPRTEGRTTTPRPLCRRFEPAIKLLLVVAYIGAVTAIPPGRWHLLLLLGAMLLVVAFLSGASVPALLRRSLLGLPFVGVALLSLLFSPGGAPVLSIKALWGTIVITDAATVLGASVLAKAWLALLASAYLVTTTEVEQLLAALGRLRCPALIVCTIAFMWRYLRVLREEAQRMSRARDARSATLKGRGGRTVWWRARMLGNLVGALSLRSFERSERVYEAMLARGFRGEMRSLGSSGLRGADVAALSFGLALLASVEVLAFVL